METVTGKRYGGRFRGNICEHQREMVWRDWLLNLGSLETRDMENLNEMDMGCRADVGQA